MKRFILLGGLLFSLCACASGPKPSTSPKLPYDSWYVGLAAPRHMEVWVETVDVLDQRGQPYFRVSAGVASYTGKVEGWHKGGGSMMPVNNVDLPQRLFLRWQSLVEPQAYRIRIPIPQWVWDLVNNFKQKAKSFGLLFTTNARCAKNSRGSSRLHRGCDVVFCRSTLPFCVKGMAEIFL